VPAISITARQIRAARGLIGWTQEHLGKAANVSRTTIAAIEKEATHPTPDVLGKIRAVFEDAQVEFLPQEGVRFRSPTIYYDDQPGANRRLLEDIFNVSSEFKFSNNINEILIFGLREEDSEDSVGTYLAEHIERLERAGLQEKILCAPNTQAFIAPKSWYRKLPTLDDRPQAPIHIYGDKIAVVQWKPKELVFVVESRPIANAVRAMFTQIWNTQRGFTRDAS
jgi:DNA-binding XRE family transcriptional regulator